MVSMATLVTLEAFEKWQQSTSFESSFRIVFKLQKRQTQDDKLGSSRAVTEANKQLIRTCVVVTMVFIVCIGRPFLWFFCLVCCCFTLVFWTCCLLQN